MLMNLSQLSIVDGPLDRRQVQLTSIPHNAQIDICLPKNQWCCLVEDTNSRSLFSTEY